jgi:hypothetical protein
MWGSSVNNVICLFFGVGLKSLATATCPLVGELWGEHYCVLGFVTLCVNELARRKRLALGSQRVTQSEHLILCGKT